MHSGRIKGGKRWKKEIIYELDKNFSILYTKYPDDEVCISNLGLEISELIRFYIFNTKEEGPNLFDKEKYTDGLKTL